MKRILTALLILVFTLSAFARMQIQLTATDVTREILLLDAFTGSPITGVTVTDLDIWFTRVETDNDVTLSVKVDISDLGSLTAVHANDSMYEIGHGYYRLDMHDDVFASGATTATVFIEDAASSTTMAVFIEFQLVDQNPYSFDKTGYALSSAGNTAVTDDWETQSQADPTGFHVNLLEIEGVDATNTLGVAQTGDSYAIVNHASYGNEHLLRPTVSGRTLDVNATSEADVNVIRWLDDIVFSPTISGVPRVDVDLWRGTAPALLSGDNVKVDILMVNGNTPPIENWEDTYDGTGYTDDNAPAKQIQVTGIGTTGAATNEFAILSPNGFTITNGLNEVNTEDDTHADNGTLHSLDNDGANILDCYYIFDIGGAFVPTNIVWRGRAFGNNDDLTVSINTGTIASPSWQERSLVEGSNSTTLVSHTFTLASNDAMTGADAGKVALRFNGTGLSSATLYTDQIVCQKTSRIDNTGYVGGQIWYNSSASNTNTVPDVDGTARNPVSTWAAALTLSGSLNITDFHIINGSTVQLTSDSSNFSLFGDNWVLDLNGQIITGAHFNGASNVSGVSTGTGYDFHSSVIMDVSFEAGDFINCVLSGDVILTAAGVYLFDDCASLVAGIATPSIDLENANENKEINLRGYKGGIEFKNFGHGTAVHTVSLDGRGQYILNINCSNADAGDIFAIRGNIEDTDNVVGGWNGTISDDARYDVGQIDDTITANSTVLDIPNTSEFEARTLTSASYFDPAADAVANVTLVATTTTNTDMVGTDGANTTVPDAAGTAASLHSTSDTLITNRSLLAASYFDPAADAVANVTLVATTTTNTDMVGTDSAATEAKQDIIDGIVDSILVLSTFMRDVMEGDVWMDTAPTPWQVVTTVKEAGGGVGGAELIRKDSKTISDGDVTSSNQRIDRTVEP